MPKVNAEMDWRPLCGPGASARSALGQCRSCRDRLRQSRILSEHADLGRSVARHRLQRHVRRRHRPCSMSSISTGRAPRRLQRPIRLAPDQYRRLVAFIRARFRLGPDGPADPGARAAAMAPTTSSTKPMAATAPSSPATNGPAARCAPPASAWACGRRSSKASCGVSIERARLALERRNEISNRGRAHGEDSRQFPSGAADRRRAAGRGDVRPASRRDGQGYWPQFLRYLHVFAGMLWIGLLYYFNFVQIPTMPSVPAELKPGVTKYIAPAALFWFRWAALADGGARPAPRRDDAAAAMPAAR